MDSIIVALITGGMSLIGVIIANNASARDMDAKLDKHLAVTDTKLEELTREVRAHNNFARRMPVVEEQVDSLRQDIKELQGLHKRPIAKE